MARIDAVGVDRGADLVQLLARVIGRDQVLAPVFDPFHRPVEFFGGDANQHILGIELAADAEAAADMRLVDMDRARRHAEHARQQFLIAMRHLGGAVQFEDAARGVVAADGAARLQRHAGMPADGKLELDDVGGVAEYRIDVAIALADHRRFAAMAGREFGRCGVRVEQRRQFFDLDRDQIGRVLGDIMIGGKDRGDRIADIAHAVFGENRLAVRIERRNAALAKIDRRHLGNVGCGPHREHARHGPRRRRVDRHDAAMGMAGAHDAHVKLMREIDIAGERAASGDQRRIFQPLDRLADERYFCARHAASCRRAFERPARHREDEIAPELGAGGDVLHRIDGGGCRLRLPRETLCRPAPRLRARAPLRQCAAD